MCMCVSRILNMKVHIYIDIIKRTDPRYTQLFYLLSIITDTQCLRYFCMLYALFHFPIHSAICSHLKFRKKCNTRDSVFLFSERILVLTVAWRMATKTQGLLTKDTSVEAVNVTLTGPAILYRAVQVQPPCGGCLVQSETIDARKRPCVILETSPVQKLYMHGPV